MANQCNFRAVTFQPSTAMRADGTQCFGDLEFNVTMTVDGETKTLSASEQLTASRALGSVQHEDHRGHDWIITLRDATQHPLLSCACFQIGELLSQFLESLRYESADAFFCTKKRMFKHINNAYKAKIEKDGKCGITVAYLGRWWMASPIHQTTSPFIMGKSRVEVLFNKIALSPLEG
eukprot:symbB.v1.2.036337.t1/scaffold5108.1/size30838/2